jgi:N-acetyl-anhydromuramoyl-L-alanine amidase
MKIDTQTGLLDEAIHHQSPNHNNRPNPEHITLLVIHNISMPAGQFGTDYVRQLFMNELDCSVHPDFEAVRGLELSAHLFITREGIIHQFVPFHLRAYHAGRSCFKGEAECNDFSIGVELEGTDNTPYTDPQYDSLVRLTRALMRAYPGITRDRITGHEQIAPGRKTDPGPAFNWDYYLTHTMDPQL